MDEELKAKLDLIDKKLDKILEYQKLEKDHWEESSSFLTKAKQWAGFYTASLIADKTLRLNG